jgi:tRNA(fMet)-specific endonuclease VapC
VTILAKAERVLLPATVLGELEAGFRLGSRLKENLATLHRFLEEPFVDVWPTTASVARRYGALFAQLRAAGTPIPTNDIWIAAAALDSGAHLVTFDGDFQHVPGLDWTLLR